MKARRRAPRDVALVAVEILRREVRGLTKRVDRLEGRRERIGFQTTDVRGDRLEQDEDDPDVPDEVP